METGEHGGGMQTVGEGQPLLVRLLGPVQAWLGDRELELGGPQRQALLALLALRSNNVVSRSELIDGLWGQDPPLSAVNALHVHVTRLRKTLEPRRASRAPGQVLLAAGSGYSLRLRPGQLDAEVFERHLDAARVSRSGGDLPAAKESLDAALRLCRTAPLPGLPGPWAEIERVRLGEQRLAAIEERAELMLILGRTTEVAAELAALVREYPLREGLRGLLMLALYRSGRQADALAEFADARGVLVEDLGLEPGPALRRLHEQILAADPALDLPAAAPPMPDRPEPAQLPADVDAFTGRAAALAELDRIAASISGSDDRPAPVVICVSGTAGVGKTALAAHWARRVRGSFPDGQLYVNLRGYDPGQPVQAGDALAGFLRALGMRGDEIPREVDERAAAYRTLLEGRRVLVVLDNAGTAEQVRPLLPGSPSNLVLVTSRDSLAGLVARHGARRLELDPLPARDSADLLRALIGDRARAEPSATATLARQCAGLPLALRVAAELATASPQMALAQLAGELADERRLELLDAGGDPGSAVRGVLSWSYHRLAAGPARTFRLLGLSPGPDLDPYAAAALTGTSHADACRALELLARSHLSHRTRPGRYSMHDLLRAYAAELAAAEDSAAERHAALTRLFDYYVATAALAMDALVPAERHIRPRVGGPAGSAPPVATVGAARGWLDSERAVLVAMTVHVEAHGWPGHATGLAGTLYRYLETGGHFPDAVTIHSAARRAAGRLGDRAAEATAHTNLGLVDWRQGRYQQAAGHHRTVLRISREIDDRQREATALNNLGIVYERQGGLDQAAKHYRQAAALAAELGDSTGEAQSLANLGGIDCLQGRYEPAASKLRRSLAIFRQIADQQGQSAVLSGLGVVNGRQGRHGQAIENYRQALAVAGGIGDRPGQIEAHNGLGVVLLAAGHPEQASVQHSAALALASGIGEKYEQARAHDGLARACQLTGDHSQARWHWEYALGLFDVLGAREADDVRAALAATGLHSCGITA
jgi:DNA-binding SARP family transcriptional activator/Flp pilus assembly protein TadD